MSKNSGSFVISLDCELMWGVRDEVTKDTYGQHILGDHEAVRKLIQLFEEFKIRATFAYVGFLTCETRQELLNHIPDKTPTYTDTNLSPYTSYIREQIGDNFENDQYNYGWHQIVNLLKHPNQEIGTHTFSHYYCLEEGQTRDQFEADLNMAIEIARKKNIHLTSIIFPRNQIKSEYLSICKQLGIVTYRGTESSWIYSARSLKKESLLRRLVRLMDAYVNLSGHHSYSHRGCVNNGMVNIPSSRFLRPYSKLLKNFEQLRLKRITNAMTYAAKRGNIYHLWWHPHNFGINQEENFLFLQKILEHYQALNKKYAFSSKTMAMLSAELLQENAGT